MAAVGFFGRRKDDNLYDRVGAFLSDHGLSPGPENYHFVYTVLTEPNGPLARAVAKITDRGLRLSRQNMAELGVTLNFGPLTAGAGANDDPVDDQAVRAEKLVAQTQAQVDGFADMMRNMRNETSDFGRDLAASAEEIRRSTDLPGMEDIARITGTMMARVRYAESKLESATAEADILRQKLAEAQDSARRDPLTGLPNRRALAEALSVRGGPGPDCIAICDVDRFKMINDQHGHGVGDRVLRAIGTTLVETLGGHLVARHGGEEFAVLMRNTTLTEAARLLDAARAAVASTRFRTRETAALIRQITLSGGVTALVANEHSDDAFARADRLLYAAKSNGRDQVCAG